MKMRTGRFPWLAVMMVLAARPPQTVEAGDPTTHWWWPLTACCPSCPDDYCRKTCPPVPPFVCSRGPDDYCAKPLPRVALFCYCGVDDYCPKPLPTVVPCYPPWYTCGVPQGRGEHAAGCACGATAEPPPSR